MSVYQDAVIPPTIYFNSGDTLDDDRTGYDAEGVGAAEGSPFEEPVGTGGNVLGRED